VVLGNDASLPEIPTLRPEPEPPPITASSVIHFIAAELSLQPSTRPPSDEYNDDIIDINTNTPSGATYAPQSNIYDTAYAGRTYIQYTYASKDMPPCRWRC